MVAHDANSNAFFRQIVANSLFTERQLSIIYEWLDGSRKPGNISSGAYYRQVRQCKDKVAAVLYSAVLLQSTGVIQPDGLAVLSRMAQQIGVILTSQPRDITRPASTDDVISVMEQLIKRISRL
jgi:hypothetical protein